MKKALKIIKNVLVWTVVAIAVFMMIFTVISVRNFDRNDRSLFGYKMYIVNSDSMAATDFDAGDLIFVKSVSPSSLKEGDIITYISQNTHNFGETVTHKIRKVTRDAEGALGFVTYGTTTGTDDEAIVTEPYVMGKYVSHLANIGHFFNFLKTPQGYIVCIFVPFILLIIYQGVKCVKLFRRYRKEQTAEMREEKEKLEAERAENERILEELRALKEQMGEKNEAAASRENELSADAAYENNQPSSCAEADMSSEAEQGEAEGSETEKLSAQAQQCEQASEAAEEQGAEA